MGYSKLCLLLLLSAYTLARESNDNEQASPCVLASRFKTYKKYVYQYTTESRNGVGTASFKVSCQVEIEVPQACRFNMYTRNCALSEESVMDPQGRRVYRQASSSEDFQVAMEKNALKFTAEDLFNVELYPETDEPVNILNIKRGIISALMVPVLEEEQNSPMSTVHGLCVTDSLVNARKDIATDVTLSRDLSYCDQFYSRAGDTSPLALLQKLHSPMSKLISSTQECNYQFDNKGKHITAAVCSEKHIFLPFTRSNDGISSVVTQELNFISSKRINNREFDVNPRQRKPLHFEDPDNKGPVQMKDTVLRTLQDLMALSGTDQGQKRTSLFHKLVSSLRVLRNETLSQVVTEMWDMSGWLTWQALFQCGTTECTSSILQVIRTIDGVSLEVDALVYGLSLQANPDAARVRDMLSMAQYKQSRPIMYALANTVKKFHKSEVTPVVTDVSKFMETLLNGCSGENPDDDTDFPTNPEETVFLVLKVVGVMGQAMQAVNPSLISTILQCAKKTYIPLSNQKAAIQAFRLMDINDEVRKNLMEVYQDARNPVEKRVAAYLILMKNPDQALVGEILNSLENEMDEQLRSFVVSHLKNIGNSEVPEMQQFREYIELAQRDDSASKNKLFDGMSSNSKIDTPLGSMQSNIIFDATNTLPKEMMLETTLKVFDYNYDIFEVGVEGRGFEPTIDALFGDSGFFPDSISKVMYWAGDKADMLRKVLDKFVPEGNRMKRQVPQDLLKDITNSVRKLVDDLRFSPSPEAIANLRLLGAEIGYMKTSDLRKMSETLFMYFHVFLRVLPLKAFSALTSSTENEVFAHYMFMDNDFSLPTVAGFPLKFSLAGVFAPGAKGGLTKSPTDVDLSFMPSVGLEFITQMGVHIPEYAEAGVEMHTNMYHESSLNAKVTMKGNQIRLSIAAPNSNTQLFSISNNILSVSSGKQTIVPSLVEDLTETAECQPIFSGLKYCTRVRYSNATSMDQAPYYPLIGDSRFAVEIQPTGEVSEYTATLTGGTRNEGKRGHHKVDYLKLAFKAEGDDSSEATASLKYNRNKNTLTSEIVIPDHNVEAGIKLAVTDSDSKGKKMSGITIDVTNRNIPQLTLVGRTRLDMMKDAMVQLQMVIPSLKTDASVTATLRRDEGVAVDFETVINLPETSSQQKASLKYDDDKLEVEFKSDMKTEIQKLIPNVEEHHRKLQHLIDNILDQKVAKTDMKLRHIVTKLMEAGDIWLDKLKTRIPCLANLQSKSMRDLNLPALPEKLFLQLDSLLQYQFNKDRMAISLPLPHGGKKSEELNIPTTISFPLVDFPNLGLYIPAKNYQLPSFTIPPSLDFTVPLLGLTEASTKVNSNFYSWEGSISAGNSTIDDISYILQYKAKAQSPFNFLSYKLEGTGMMTGRADDHFKYLLNSSLNHCLLDTSFSVLEALTVTNKLNARANYKIEAFSPVGLQASYYYSAQSTSTLDSDEAEGDGTMDGSLKIGSFHTTMSYTNNYNLHPLEGEGRGESSLDFECPFIDIHNTIHWVYANSELKIVSKTHAQEEALKHVAELKYKESQLTLKCNAIATAMGILLKNNVELGVSSYMAILRIETQADDEARKAYSLITGSLDSDGLEVNSEGSLTFETSRGLHKASVMVGRNGVTTSGTNSIQCSIVTVENVFSGAIDNNGLQLTSLTKAMGEDSRGELNIQGKIAAAEASLTSIFKGYASDATTRHNMNIVLNSRALTLTNNAIGTFKQLNTENSQTLTLTLWTLALHSKSNNLICEDVYYKQDTKVDIKPFVMSFDMTNDLKFYDVSFNNEGHMKLKPSQLDVSGSMKGSYGEEHNIKHTYEINYGDMAGTLKYSTSGNIMDAQLSHNCELEFAGLSSKSNCEAKINSEFLHLDSSIRTMALPFSLTIDAFINADGEINLYRKNTGQLYSKLLVKAEPLALAYSHDCRVSTTHMLSSGESFTNVDNKFDGLLTPSEQSLNWKVESKLNNHAYKQDIRTYNNPGTIGLDFSAVMNTDIFSRPELQEYSMAGFLKYDKNSDCHIIDIPFIKSFPVAFERLKNTLIQVLESLQQSINNLNIKELISDFRAKLDRLPMQVSDFMRRMNLEKKVNQVKAKLDYFINEFSVTMEDFEVAMYNLRKNLENKVMDIATKIRDFILSVKDYVKAGHVADKIENVLSKIGNQLQDFDQRYKIKQSLITAFNAIEDIIRQIDLQKLTEGSAAWLRELDSKFEILDQIKNKLSEMKQAIKNFDINMLIQDLKDYFLSIDFAMYAEQLSYKIPSSDIAKVIESMTDVINNWIDEYEIPVKINALYSYIRDLLLRYRLDDKFKELMDRVVILIKEFKIKETVQSLVDALKAINFNFIYDKIMQFLDSVTIQLKAIDFRKMIDDLNEKISSMLASMKEFDYSAFVDESNKKIADLTSYINEQIKTYEIVQKIEAVREFFREIQNSFFTYLDELKNTKVADALKKLKNVLDTTFYNDIKMKIQDILEDIRQRILNMDIRNEMYIYLQRASESYSNVVAYMSGLFNQLIDKIKKLASDNKVLTQIKQSVDGVFDELKRAEIEIPTFTVPLTDLVIPAFTINLNKLQEISIPAQISVPEVTILNSYKIPAFTIDYDEIKAYIISIIDKIRELEIQTPDPEEIFGDLKVLYLYELPDFTFQEITLSEIKFPNINIPKLNLKDFEITMLPIPEIKLPEIPSDICVPTFGKFHGEFRLNSPQYTSETIGKIENSTSTPKNPQFTATLTSTAKSSMKPLEYTFEASAQLEAPRMKKLVFTEKLKARNVGFSIDHEGSLILTGSSAEVSSKTTSKATTEMYTANLINNMALMLKNGISASLDTTYDHNLDILSIDTSSRASIKQNLAATIESGGITISGETTGNGKWSIQDYTDEGTHKSNAEFTIDLSTAKLSFEGDTNCMALKSKQSLTAESVILSHITVDARCETEVRSVKKSLMILNAKAHIGEFRVTATASHYAEFTGSLTGFMANSLEFIAYPFEIVLDVKNKVNSKMFFPLKLTGKMDLQHDYGVILNSEKQRVCGFTFARFNQYKYNHNFTAENNEMAIFLYLSANGEANLDFLTVPLSIPEITVPYLKMKTPEIRDLSLWENSLLETLLTTPQQSFDMNLKLDYYKNSDTHSIDLHLEPIYTAITNNGNIFQAHFEQCRDKLVAVLKDSYNRAKLQFIKHKIDTSSRPPRIITVPGYKIPILNIEVSAFRAELPAFSYFAPKEVSTPGFNVPALGFSVPSYTLVLPSLELPVIHVPETLSMLKLPTFTVPAIQNVILIPAMGNITCDFSFKSPVITLSANAGLYNRSDIVFQFDTSSTSVFEPLNVKIDGTTSLTMKRGMKLGTTVSLRHNNGEANHESDLFLTKKSMEAAVINTAKISLPLLNLEWYQVFNGNTENEPNVAYRRKLNYMFNIPLIEPVFKETPDINLAMDAPSSYASLEPSTEGISDITTIDSYNLAGVLENEVSFHLNSNRLNSNVRTEFVSYIDNQQRQKRSSDNNVFRFGVNKILAFEVSLQQMFATVDYTSDNDVNFASFKTNGKHIVKGEMLFVPLTTFKTTLNIDASQPSILGHAGLIQSINLAISSEKQSLSWSGKEQLASFIHAFDFLTSNSDSELRMDLTVSVEGHQAFLKSIRLPVYQKTLWNVLKYDQVTSMDDLQFLNISSSIVYTKSMDGLEYKIPFKLFEHGITFNIPQISTAVPSWIKKNPRSKRNIDMQMDNLDVPDHLIFPPQISFPAFYFPFTNLHVKRFTIDPQNLTIPKVITTAAFKVMLPGLPVVSVPSYDIETDYIQGKMAFLSLKVPRHGITVSSFTLPNHFKIGERTIGLNEIANQFFNLELPTIVIPEKTYEIPETVLNLPASIFIPAFGALQATVTVSSPIYNVSAIASLGRNDTSLVTSLNSICTSTMIFLEYDLSASATLGFDNGVINLNGKCNFIHSDVNVNWQHVYSQNLRMKRQAPMADSKGSHHTLNVDISSPTFVDANLRFASRKDGLTASISSPSSGFLGLQFQRRSPSQLNGKLFSRYLSSPEKDIDVFNGKATLRNSQKLILETSWNPDFLHDVIEGTKDRIPAVTDALLKFINKYHIAHFGFDLNRGGMKLKNTVSNAIERAYHEVPMSLNKVRNSVKQLSGQGQDMYKKVSNSLMSISGPDVIDRVAHNARQLLKHTEDAATQLLSDTKFTFPGSEEKLSSLEMLEEVDRILLNAINRFGDLVEKISRYIREIRFTIPGTNVVVNGNEIMDKLSSVFKELRDSLSRRFGRLHKTVNDLPDLIRDKAQHFITYLKDENMEIASKVDAIYEEVLQSSNQHTEEAKRYMVEYKDNIKLKIQEVYNAVRVEQVNNNTKEIISILQSHLYGGLDNSIDILRRASQNTAPYIRVRNKKMDIEIPLPFLWKSFSELPLHSNQ